MSFVQTLNCDLSQAEKKLTAVKDMQLCKMTIIFTQNSQKLSFCVKIVIIFETFLCYFYSITVIFFSVWSKWRVPTAKSLNICRPHKIVSEGTLQTTLKPTEACMEEIKKSYTTQSLLYANSSRVKINCIKTSRYTLLLGA